MENKFITPMLFTGNLAENWRRFRQKFEIYSTATELEKKGEKTQCAQLIYLMGDEAINIFTTFTFTDEEKNKIEVLKTKFETYFVPKKNLTFERYRFFTMRQVSETIEQFVTSLKNQANNCEFTDEKLKKDLIKTMLIAGMKDDAVREKLLQRDTQDSLEEAIECCTLTEATRHQLEEMGSMEQKPIKTEIDAIRRRKAENFQSTAVHPSTSENFEVKNCHRCSRTHAINKCPAFGKTCNICNKFNHFAVVCKNKYLRNGKRIDNIDQCNNSDNVIDNLVIDSVEVKSRLTSCYKYLLVEGGMRIKFKIDTGADANIISLNILKQIDYDIHKIERTTACLSTYTNHKIPIIGKCFVKLQYMDKIRSCVFYVENSNRQSILGFSDCLELNIVKINEEEGLKNINNINLEYDMLLSKYKAIFSGIGRLGEPYHIEIDESIQPVVKPIRKVPFALQGQFRNYLKELEQLKIITKIDYHTEWCNSFVLVRKADNSIRICLDPRDLNNAIKTKAHKMLTFDEIAAKLNGARYFSTLDARSGFWSIPLDSESSDLCTFGTPYGIYKFLRLPFGIKTASEIFEERFKSIFNIPGVEIYVDDILIFGSTKEEHDNRLEQVFNIALKENIKFNLNKCHFGMNEIKYLGHKISDKGISLDDEKIKAILDMSEPKNNKEVQRFLGLITYVGRFIKNLSERTQPLRDIIKKDNVFIWGRQQQQAFDSLKQLIVHKETLQFFDPNKPVVLSVDASSYGLGAVLIQDKKPCAYASKSMTETQRRYAQIEKELLAIYFGVTRFHQFVCGRKFTVETDHKPLIAIFKKSLNSCPTRLQRMLLSLQNYDIHLVYRPGKELIIADNLSRAPLRDEFHNNLDLESQICVVSKKIDIEETKLRLLVNDCDKDDELKVVKQFIKDGWPTKSKNVPNNIIPYYNLKSFIVEYNNLIYLNDRLVVPKSWRNKMLALIHCGHLGITKNIQRAKHYLYWPGMIKDITNYVNCCDSCQKYAKANLKEPMISHQIERVPWYKVGIDIYEFNGQSYLLIVDYYSKYPEIVNLNNNLTASNVIGKIKSIFARHGIPAIVITDAGKQFTGDLFAQFSEEWRFTHKVASPHHQQTNGLAERTIQSIKNLIKKTIDNNEDVYLALLSFRNTPVYDSFSPSQILMSRCLRDNLPIQKRFLQPKVIDKRRFHSKISENQNLNKK